MACNLHPKYQGLRRPRANCAGCLAFYNENQDAGIKENRKKKIEINEVEMRALDEPFGEIENNQVELQQDTSA